MATTGGSAQRLARRAFFRVAHSPLRWVCDTRIVCAASQLFLEMRSADVAELAGALDAAGVQWWLAGGWATDALLGRQTRPHMDADVVVDESPQTLQAVEAALASIGLRLVAQRHTRKSITPRRLWFAAGDGRGVDVLPVDLDAPPFGGADQNSPSFCSGEVDGRRVPCLAVRVQLLHHGGHASRKRRNDLLVLRALQQREASRREAGV